MKTTIHKNGAKSIWDDTLKVGDFITAYHKGFHQLVKIEDRGSDKTPLFHYMTQFDSNGFPTKARRVLACDATYCRNAKRSIEDEILRRQSEIRDLKQLFDSL